MKHVSPVILRGIIILYLLLFLTALISSGYLLRGVINLRPIPMIGLLKYSLLCVLFLILSWDTIKAMTLKPANIHQLGRSTKNFKWLFTIAIIICVGARIGLFNSAAGKTIEITLTQIGILAALALFCFWSDLVLREEEIPQDEI